jgi:hypothetical protein
MFKLAFDSSATDSLEKRKQVKNVVIVSLDISVVSYEVVFF